MRGAGMFHGRAVRKRLYERRGLFQLAVGHRTLQRVG